MTRKSKRRVGSCRGSEKGWGGGGIVVGVEVLSFQCLPGDHRAGLRLAGGGGGGAELREAAVARLQAGHRTPEVRDRDPEEHVSAHKLHTRQRTSNMQHQSNRSLPATS